MQFDTSYLNKTPNKTARNTTSFKPEFVILHETAGYGSLEWNLRPEVRSSYNYLIARDGKTYHYVNEKAYVAWHAGVRSWARGYSGGEINVHAIGVEVEGPNDGTPITTAQTKSLVELIRYFRDTYAIPISRDYFFAHSTVAPGYKDDPRGYSVEYTLKLLDETIPSTGPRPNTLGAQLRNEVYTLAKGEYRPDWVFHQYAFKHKLGSPIRVGMDFSVKGIRYTGEVYGRDVIISPYNQWDIVLRANELTDQDVYNALMQYTYGALGVDYRPDQAFYQFISQIPRKAVGVPLSNSNRLQASDGAAYAAQIFSLDTLYTPIATSGTTNWSVVKQLSAIVAVQNTSAVDAALREIISRAMYTRINSAFDAKLPFIKKAIEAKLGAPLSSQRRWSYRNNEYVYVVYAGDTLFALANKPDEVRRLSEQAD
ncbi:N-acetylmuramoyl-L-alanine amidase [Herpetosiphon llansteffanensis]